MPAETTKTYVPNLHRDSFIALPERVVLEGSPADYKFPRFSLKELDDSSRGEAVGRVFTGLRGRTKWTAVRVSRIKDSMAVELKMRKEEPPRYDFPRSMLMFGDDGVDNVLKGIQECIECGWLGSGEDAEGNQIVWPTPELLNKMSVYRTKV